MIRNVGQGAAFNIRIESHNESSKCNHAPRIIGPGQQVTVGFSLPGHSHGPDIFTITCKGSSGGDWSRSIQHVRRNSGELPNCEAIVVDWLSFEEF